MFPQNSRTVDLNNYYIAKCIDTTTHVLSALLGYYLYKLFGKIDGLFLVIPLCIIIFNKYYGYNSYGQNIYIVFLANFLSYCLNFNNEELLGDIIVGIYIILVGQRAIFAYVGDDLNDITKLVVLITILLPICVYSYMVRSIALCIGSIIYSHWLIINLSKN